MQDPANAADGFGAVLTGSSIPGGNGRTVLSQDPNTPCSGGIKQVC
jgi:hypothetical protein